MLISTKLTLKILTLNELHPVEGPELSKVTAEDPAPLEWGQHTVPPLGVYIKGEEEIKKEKEERRKGKRWEEGWGQALRENKAEGIYVRSVPSSLDGAREEEAGAGPAHARPPLGH